MERLGGSFHLYGYKALEELVMAETMIEIGWFLTKWVTIPILIIGLVALWVSKRT